MMPLAVRIPARSLGPLRNAATVTSCKYPAFQLPSATGKPGRICSKKPAPGMRSGANGGHGGALATLSMPGPVSPTTTSLH
jgi:hypothetical protein